MPYLTARRSLAARFGVLGQVLLEPGHGVLPGLNAGLLVPGRADNIKVTQPDDLLLAAAVLGRRR